MLTKQDLKQIAAVVDERLEIKLEEKLEAKFEEKLGRYPTKDEFYKAMDKLTGLIMEMREEKSMLAFRVSDHEERITALEKTTATN